MTEESQAVADIDISWWREKGILTVQGVDYRVSREGMMSGDFVLESAGSVGDLACPHLVEARL